MDNVVTVYHGRSVEEDDFGNIRFVGMQRAPMLFVGRPLFAEVLARASDLIHCNSNDGEIKVEGVLHYGKSGLTYHRRLFPIACQDDWENYVAVVMDDEIRALDLFIRKSSREAYPHGLPMDLNDPFCSYQHSTATSSSNTTRRVPASATCYIRAAALSHSLASPLPLVMPSLRRMNKN